jgi:uncharacterized membrane protein YgaE (UPF0421/DUF939 family)
MKNSVRDSGTTLTDSQGRRLRWRFRLLASVLVGALVCFVAGLSTEWSWSVWAYIAIAIASAVLFAIFGLWLFSLFPAP